MNLHVQFEDLQMDLFGGPCSASHFAKDSSRWSKSIYHFMAIFSYLPFLTYLSAAEVCPQEKRNCLSFLMMRCVRRFRRKALAILPNDWAISAVRHIGMLTKFIGSDLLPSSEWCELLGAFMNSYCSAECCVGTERMSTISYLFFAKRFSLFFFKVANLQFMVSRCQSAGCKRFEIQTVWKLWLPIAGLPSQSSSPRTLASDQLTISFCNKANDRQPFGQFRSG